MPLTNMLFLDHLAWQLAIYFKKIPYDSVISGSLYLLPTMRLLFSPAIFSAKQVNIPSILIPEKTYIPQRDAVPSRGVYFQLYSYLSSLNGRTDSCYNMNGGIEFPFCAKRCLRKRNRKAVLIFDCEFFIQGRKEFSLNTEVI